MGTLKTKTLLSLEHSPVKLNEFDLGYVNFLFDKDEYLMPEYEDGLLLCGYCGHNIEANHNFCWYCGQRCKNG